MTIAPLDDRAESAFTGLTSIRAAQPEGGPQMDTSHVSALQLKHAGLERRIERERSRPLPDDVVIQSLKKQKLRIKEQIEHI
jgi:hypothetical protein